MATEVLTDSGGVKQSTEGKDENVGNLTINPNTSALNDSALARHPDELYKHGFSLRDLYKISLEFYRKEKDLIVIPYDDKVRLVALWKQVSNGKYDENKMPEVGYFDVIGNDRRKAWQSLGDMAPDVAKKEFCDLLDANVASYAIFVTNRKQEIEAEIKRKRKEDEERRKQEEEERMRKEEQEKIKREEEERLKLVLEAEKLRIKAESEQCEKELVDGKIIKPSDPKLVTSQVNGTNGNAIAAASLWTRPKLQEFVNHVKRDASSVLVVGRGETVTIRVPTHEHGSCLFWEFATESYDVGFGVYFEWASNSILQNKNSQSANGEKTLINHDMDNVENESKPLDQIVIHENEHNIEVYDKPDEVLPVLRRNSHEEVIVGSHMYPGHGIYLLKFDNSYSLLRSKTLYYRVYYTK